MAETVAGIQVGVIPGESPATGEKPGSSSPVPAASSPCSFNFATGYGLFSLRRSNYGSLVQIFPVQLVGAPHITDPAAILNGKRVKISIIQRS